MGLTAREFVQEMTLTMNKLLIDLVAGAKAGSSDWAQAALTLTVAKTSQ